jgi:hypothetical protein
MTSIYLSITYQSNGKVSIGHVLDEGNKKSLLSHVVCDHVVFRHTDYVALSESGDTMAWFNCVNMNVVKVEE